MIFDNGHGTREGENWDKNISINVPHKSFSSVKQGKEKIYLPHFVIWQNKIMCIWILLIASFQGNDNMMILSL